MELNKQIESKTKIAFVIHGLSMGGAEKFLISIINHFELNKYNPILILFSKENTLLEELNGHIKVYKLIRTHKYDYTILKKLKSILLSEGISKVFCINTFSFFLTRIALYNNKNIELFLSLHTTMPNSFKNYLLNIVYYRFFKKQDKIIYLCENQKQFVRKTYFLKTENEFIINNGIDIDYFNPEKYTYQDYINFKEAYNLNINEKVIIKVARIEPEKGHIDAIEALFILHNKFKEKVHLFFIGNGSNSYIKILQKLAFKRELHDYIHFTGVIKDVRNFYHFANLFTLTSFSTETFSLAALEAMAFGLPCSLTNIGGAAEMSINGKTGILTTPHDPLEIANSWYRILNGSSDGKFIREHVVKNYNHNLMLKNYISLIG